MGGCSVFDDGTTAVPTDSDGIELGGERFVGRFVYGKDGEFHYCMLAPLTEITDTFQSEREVLTEFHICDKDVSDIGNRVGQFKTDIVKHTFRDASSIAEKYFLLNKKDVF